MKDDVKDFAFCIILPVIALLTVAMILFAGIRQLDHHYTGNSCRQFAIQADYKTKMAEYSYWNYECLVKVNGKWIPKEQIRGEQ